MGSGCLCPSGANLIFELRQKAPEVAVEGGQLPDGICDLPPPFVVELTRYRKLHCLTRLADAQHVRVRDRALLVKLVDAVIEFIPDLGTVVEPLNENFDPVDGLGSLRRALASRRMRSKRARVVFRDTKVIVAASKSVSRRISD